jgi:hypothetical protein
MQSRVKGSQGEQNLRLHSVKFGNKPDFRLLQAADILAYEWGKELRRLNLPPNPKTLSTRSSLASLLDQTHIHQHFGASDLHDFFTGNRDELIQRMQRFSDVEEAKLSLLMRLKSIPSVSGR